MLLPLREPGPIGYTHNVIQQTCKIFRDSNGDQTRDPDITCPSALPLSYIGSLKIGITLHKCLT